MFLLAASWLSVAAMAQNAETISVAGASNGKFTANGTDCRIEGQVLNGQKEGTWVEYFPGDKFLPKRIVTYANGKKNGLYLEIDNTGSVTKQAEYKNDILNGQVTCWYRGGRLSRMNSYKDGKLDGRQIICYEKGGVQEESNYLNDQRHGVCTWFDESGNKLMSIEYNAGKFEGKQETYYSNGRVKSSKVYKDNKQNGDAREFYDNGALKSEATYKNGELSGNVKSYEKKNTSFISGNADDGKKH